jgi:hypothetical protein
MFAREGDMTENLAYIHLKSREIERLLLSVSSCLCCCGERERKKKGKSNTSVCGVLGALIDAYAAFWIFF